MGGSGQAVAGIQPAHGPVTSARRAASHPQPGPRLRTPSQAEWTLWFPPCGSHSGLCAGDHRFPPPVPTLQRPRFRTRPCSPRFLTAGFYPRAKGGDAGPLAGRRAARVGAAARAVREPCRRAGVAPLEGTGGACGCGTAHSLPKRVSLHSPSLPLPLLSRFTCPRPARGHWMTWEEGREKGVKKKKGSFLNGYLLVVSCIFESAAFWLLFFLE